MSNNYHPRRNGHFSPGKADLEKGKEKTDEFKLKSELREVYAKIGELVYDQRVNGSAIDGVDALISKATSIKAAQKALEEKIAAREAAEAAAGRTW